MNKNFLNFITDDIAAKKALIASLPTKTKVNKRKYNEKIDEMISKYEEYSITVKTYLDAKTRSFELKEIPSDIDKTKEIVTNLEHVKFLLNPTNTYFEKLGFDNILYKINHYYEFNFDSLNEIINNFIDIFDGAGIKLTDEDFKYTCYVHEFMAAFLDFRNKIIDSYDKVSEIFERIYWENPELIEHIALSFRKITRKYERKLNAYISKLQKEACLQNNIKSYNECLERLRSAYVSYKLAGRENITDIIKMARNKQLDINQYFEDNKIRQSSYSSLITDSSILEDKDEMEKVYENLIRLEANVEEYICYEDFEPLFNSFKDDYKKLIPTDPKNVNDNKALKNLQTKINEIEDKLEKINKKIIGGKPSIFNFGGNSNVPNKNLKIESLRLAKELPSLYKKLDAEYFNSKVKEILSTSLTVADVLHLYYSFDYFKKFALKKIFRVEKYEELLKYSESFDLFAMDPTTIIINGIPLFDETNISRIIANKYRLQDINVTEEALAPENLKPLLNKIKLILRVNIIENSKTDVEKIWFMVEVDKINAKLNAKIVN